MQRNLKGTFCGYNNTRKLKDIPYSDIDYATEKISMNCSIKFDEDDSPKLATKINSHLNKLKTKNKDFLSRKVSKQFLQASQSCTRRRNGKAKPFVMESCCPKTPLSCHCEVECKKVDQQPMKSKVLFKGTSRKSKSKKRTISNNSAKFHQNGKQDSISRYMKDDSPMDSCDKNISCNCQDNDGSSNHNSIGSHNNARLTKRQQMKECIKNVYEFYNCVAGGTEIPKKDTDQCSKNFKPKQGCQSNDSEDSMPQKMKRIFQHFNEKK